MATLYLGNRKVTPAIDNRVLSATVNNMVGTVTNGVLSSPSAFKISFNGVSSISNYGMTGTFNSKNVNEIDFTGLVTCGVFSMYDAFFKGFNGRELNLVDLKTINNYGMCECFYQCTSITKVWFPKLDALRDYSLYNCFSVSSSGNTTLTDIYFPSLKSTSFTNQTCFKTMIGGRSSVKVHFPINLQSVIGSWTDVTAGFGGTNTSVLYDLEETE
jgi:hypothetical protein